jgi:hypothetical protein
MAEQRGIARQQMTVWSSTWEMLRELSYETRRSQVELLDEAVRDLVVKYQEET